MKSTLIRIHKSRMNALKIIRDTWSKAHQFFFFHKETSVTKYQKNVATAVDVEASEWVEEITINDEALMSNKKHINVEDVPETARPENIKKVRRATKSLSKLQDFNNSEENDAEPADTENEEEINNLTEETSIREKLLAVTKRKRYTI
ncbi:hypothetical protein RhiirC2_867282 [Rhizophagus irregularis]|uniref:Uncharacterized protein n=1 Tax=Rhizophagus irregularis TaxID=588596 RepID=A0A2N1N3C4_9GLOM|nr:hypothetical protein RhiirC2_867282 [Rhizophagus irregularis]